VQTLLELTGAKAAGFEEPKVLGIPVTLGISTGISQMSAGSEARKIDLALRTLAENVLRARTGAQAPEEEKISEQKRSFIRLLEAGRPDVILERLETNEDFLKLMVNSIDPEGIFGELFDSEGVSGESIDPEGVSGEAIDQELDSQVNQFLDSLGVE
jgi:hypothetical protein